MDAALPAPQFSSLAHPALTPLSPSAGAALVAALPFSLPPTTRSRLARALRTAAAASAVGSQHAEGIQRGGGEGGEAEGKKGSPREHNDSLNLFVGSLTCGAWCGRMLGDDDAGGKHLLPFHLTHPFEKRTITVPV